MISMLMRSLCRLLILAYRTIVRPIFPTACKYYPTCSHYAEEAIAKHGAWRGARMATNRLLRCHPLSAGGYDPVPEKGE